MTLTSTGPAPFAAPPRVPVRAKSGLYPFVLPLGVFLLTRLFSGILMVVFSRHQIALGVDTIPGLFVFQPTPADPGYLGITTNWDGQWYQSIATSGYQPAAAGQAVDHDQIWAWAFPPAFPLLVGSVMQLTGLSFAVASMLVTGIAGATAMVLLFRLLEDAGGRWVATSGVVLACCFVSAPLFQAAYTESLGLALLLATLLLVRRHLYWLAILPTTALMFTRLITPVLCVVVLVAVASRVRSDGWRSLTGREWSGAAALSATALAGAVAWPSLASALMGEVGRFNRTTKLVSDINFGWFGAFWVQLGIGGVLVVVALLILLVLGALSRRGRLWGLELRVWSVAYPLFLFCLTSVSGGALRYALLSPTLGLLLVGRPSEEGPSRSQVAVVGVAAVVGLACQWLFIRHMMVIDHHPLML